MLGNTDYKLNELEKQVNKLTDDYEALIIQIGMFKKKIDSLSSENASLHLRLDTVESVLEENHLAV